MKELKQDIEDRPDDYNYERAARFNVSTDCICAAIKRLEISYKKTLKHLKADPIQRAIYGSQLKHYKKEGRPIVYLDDSGFSVSSPRTHGYSQKGKRCYGSHNWQEKGRVNVIGGILNKNLFSVSLWDCSIDSDVFHEWVKTDLLNKLPDLNPIEHTWAKLKAIRRKLRCDVDTLFQSI